MGWETSIVFHKSADTNTKHISYCECGVAGISTAATATTGWASCCELAVETGTADPLAWVIMDSTRDAVSLRASERSAKSGRFKSPPYEFHRPHHLMVHDLRSRCLDIAHTFDCKQQMALRT
ncbi:hypothetical protein B566_EDAN007250 [Ephemera danica]|nr:hypothetical protein B566_EDAN007250 [Ephemera danica]